MGNFRSLALAGLVLLAGCDDDFPSWHASDGGASNGDGGLSGSDGATGTDDDGGTIGPEPTGPCEVTFRFVPPSGTSAQSVEARGEWDGFVAGTTLAPVAGGAFEGRVTHMPGLVAYKLVVDGNWQLDPGARLRKYVGNVENSAVRVANCHIPALSLTSKSLSRAQAGQGQLSAEVAFAPSVEGAQLDAASVHATLRRDGAATAVAQVSAAGTQIKLTVPQLSDGKYTVLVNAADRNGHAAHPLRLVFWVEAQPFEWQDALLYMTMTDRFRDGDPSNNPAKTAGVDVRVDFQGGDLDGVRAAVNDGTFDKLGVTALWLSPFPTNPSGPWKAADGVHDVMGYHGYWPVRPRAVEPRLGGEVALKALVKEAHAHGIRVLADFVVNHVHQEHDYFQQHPSWFRTGCVCGGPSCDWTEHRLDCLFAPYLPDVNWTVPEVSEQYGDDAVWWLDTFDLDGLRVDAVKHVEDLAVINLSARIRDEFEAAGTRVLLTGETAMGWSDCGLACNADQYGTISRYIGPDGLDGQADFVLYHAVPYRAFAADQKGMIHVDYWTQQSVSQYPADALMTPYIGSHDTARFVTLASYRGQDASHDPGVPNNQWDQIASMPPDGEPYARLRLAMSWLLTLPGAPLVYYGDEYGEWGGVDPNNRVLWRGNGTLSSDEQATLTRVRALGTARRELVALRRGDYRSLSSTEDTLVYARVAAPGQVAIVALTRAAGGATASAVLPTGLGLADGTVLHDRLGGPDVKVVGAAISVPLGGRGAVVLAP